jgi:hypothetical protein
MDNKKVCIGTIGHTPSIPSSLLSAMVLAKTMSPHNRDMLDFLNISSPKQTKEHVLNSQDIDSISKAEQKRRRKMERNKKLATSK